MDNTLATALELQTNIREASSARTSTRFQQGTLVGAFSVIENFKLRDGDGWLPAIHCTGLGPGETGICQKTSKIVI